MTHTPPIPGDSAVSDATALAEAKREALYLAKTLHRLHYSHVTQWKPLDDVAGIISQIDNMVAGLVKPEAVSDAMVSIAYNAWVRCPSRDHGAQMRAALKAALSTKEGGE